MMRRSTQSMVGFITTTKAGPEHSAFPPGNPGAAACVPGGPAQTIVVPAIAMNGLGIVEPDFAHRSSGLHHRPELARQSGYPLGEKTTKQRLTRIAFNLSCLIRQVGARR